METESSHAVSRRRHPGIGIPLRHDHFVSHFRELAILSAIPPLPPVIRIMSLFYFMVITSGLAFATTLDRAAQSTGRLVSPARH
jgi:hypothetical protein